MARVTNRRDIMWRRTARLLTIGACIIAFVLGLFLPTRQSERFAAAPDIAISR